MNLAVMKGNLTKDVETRTLQNGTFVANFSIAVARRFKREGQPETDFFNCTAFGKTGEFVSNYFSKGKTILVTGNIQNRSWEDKEGVKHYATDIMVDNAEFCEKKSDSDNGSSSVSKQSALSEEFAGEFSDEDVPF